MNRNKWLLSIIMAGLAVVLLSGCSLGGGGNKTGQIDPPPQDMQRSDSEEHADQTNVDTETGLMDVTAYFKDVQGFVVPLTLQVPEDPGKARVTLEHMVEGGPGEAMLPEGFTALIPKGTELEMNIVANNTAIVDFSEEFTHYNAQDERKILEAITWALTGYDTIDQVVFWVNGEPLPEMPKDATPLDDTLTRAMGINLERAHGVLEYGQSTPVTLFFQNQTSAGQAYYVPVTRMIARTDNVALATVNELIKGPMNEQLASVFVPDTQVLHVTKMDNLVNVNFDSTLLNPDQEAAAESIESVILSLTETTGLNKVQIMVDGSVEVRDTKDHMYNTPVWRPTNVNKIDL